MFARERTAALQVAALSKSLASLSEGRRRALLNLIDETVLVEDYSSVFSANFPPSPQESRKGTIRRRFFLPIRIPFEVHVSRNACGTSEKKGKAIAGCNKCPAISKRREGHAEGTIDFPRISISKSPKLSTKTFETVGRKIQPFPLLLGFTIDLSKESSVGRGTLSNPAIDSDNIIRCVEHFLRVDCFVWCNNIYIYIERCSFLFSRRIELGRIQLKLIVSN